MRVYMTYFARTLMLVVMFAVASTFMCSAYEFSQNNICYTVISDAMGTVEVSRGNYCGDIFIPQQVFHDEMTYTVIAIGDNAFSSCHEVTSVYLPNSIKTIGADAFTDCTGLTSINLPNSLNTIGERAYSECTGITSLDIPNSVTTIAEFAFYRCHGIKSISIPTSVTSIGQAAFYECESVSSVTIPNSISVLSQNLFMNCSGLTEVNIPNSVTEIGDGVFLGCTSLATVSIPKSVVSIGSWAFSGCENLETINIEEGNINYTSLDGVIYNKDLSALIQCAGGKTTVHIPSSVREIGDKAFFGCRKLISIEIPESVRRIDSKAFDSCNNLSSIYLPESVEEIGENAFQNCSGIKSIKIEHKIPIECNPGFSESNYKYSWLRVPVGSLEAYENAEPWKNFVYMEEYDFSGVSAVSAYDSSDIQIEIDGDRVLIQNLESNEALTIYDMNGKIIYSGPSHVVYGLTPGIYIVKAGNKTCKFSL